ncbi:hypothetical protein ADMFC3_27870 [Geovibrio sp. ADMFC3]
MKDFGHYPWSTDYKRLWEMIGEFIKEHDGQVLWEDINILALCDMTWSDKNHLGGIIVNHNEDDGMSIRIGNDPDVACIGEIDDSEDFGYWAFSINLRFLDPCSYDALCLKNTLLEKQVEELKIALQEAVCWHKYPERIPTEREQVIVEHKNGDIVKRRYCKEVEQWIFFDHPENNPVVRWTPFPKDSENYSINENE